MTSTYSPTATAPSAANICAVIVTYQPTEKNSYILESLAESAARILLVENGTERPSELLTSYAEGDYAGRLEILTCPENNLAKAQNMGIRKAIQQGYGWILLLDDDSRPSPAMTEHMHNAWAALPEQERETIGLIAPNIQDEAMTRPDGFLKLWKRVLFYKERFDGNTKVILRDILYVPASGSLLPASMFAELGYMDEVMNIYFVDTDFCLRLRAKGYDIMAVQAAKMHHRIGRRTTHKIMGLNVTTTNHPPRARYFMYRNRMKLWKRYALTFPGYVLFDMLRAKYELLRILLLESDKKQKNFAIAAGIRDGIRGQEQAML